MKKQIEMYVGYSDNTWDIMVVEVPTDTPNKLLGYIAEAEVTRVCWKEEKRIVSFASICSTDPEEFGE